MRTMSERMTRTVKVAYGDVDRAERILLSRVFKLLQDAAIAHANQFGTGTEGAVARGETWVLSRIAVAIDRYAHPDEELRVETWSTGIRGFKGFRDFRVVDAHERVVVAASSVWIYLNLRTKSIARVPREVAAGFPVGAGSAWCPELEKTAFESPAATAVSVPITLRYSDVDVNAHVNNAAYLDFAQTALARSGHNAYPQRIRLNYGKAIPADAEGVVVQLEANHSGTRFAVWHEKVVCALGEASPA